MSKLNFRFQIGDPVIVNELGWSNVEGEITGLAAELDDITNNLVYTYEVSTKVNKHIWVSDKYLRLVTLEYVKRQKAKI